MTQLANPLGSEEILELIKRAYKFAKPNATDVYDRITLKSSMDELGIESVTALEMVGFIEEELNVHFLDKELSSIRGIGDLRELVIKYQQPVAAQIP